MFLGHAPLVVKKATSNFPLPPVIMAWLPSKDTLHEVDVSFEGNLAIFNGGHGKIDDAF